VATANAARSAAAVSPLSPKQKPTAPNGLPDLGHGNYVHPDRVTVTENLTNEWLPARRADWS